MKVIEIVGFSDSGKTVLIESLVKIYSQKGLKIGAIKKSFHHEVEYDKEGKDTYRMEKAGAHMTGGFSRNRAFISYNSSRNPFDFIKNFIENDLILIEGDMGFHAPKVFCIKNGDVPQDPLIVAYFSLNPVSTKELTKKLYHKENIEELADYLLQITPNLMPHLDCGKCGFDCKTLTIRILEGQSREEDCKVLYGTKCKVTIDGYPIELMPFLDTMLQNIIKGFLSPLKGYREGKIKIEIEE